MRPTAYSTLMIEAANKYLDILQGQYEAFTDPRDGNKYKTVKIGDKIWMAENLAYAKVTHYYPNNDRTNVKDYGYLYTWVNAKKACPPGWRLPTKEEFEQLLAITGAGKDSSSIRVTSWSSGSNSSGFGAFPAGYRLTDGGFYFFEAFATFWSATTLESGHAYFLDVNCEEAYVKDYNRDCALSVRCVKEIE